MSASRAALALVTALCAAVAYVALSYFVLGHFDVLELGIPFVAYNTPIGMVLVVWLFDRAWLSSTRAQHVLAAFVIVCSLVRMMTDVPPWSGHALFLSFAFATARSSWVRAAALAALGHVVFLKMRFDDVSWAWGIGAGLALALAHRSLARLHESSARDPPRLRERR